MNIWSALKEASAICLRNLRTVCPALNSVPLALREASARGILIMGRMSDIDLDLQDRTARICPKCKARVYLLEMRGADGMLVASCGDVIPPRLWGLRGPFVTDTNHTPPKSSDPDDG